MKVALNRLVSASRTPLVMLLGCALLPLETVSANNQSRYESVAGIRQQVQQFIDSYDFASPYPATSSVGKVDNRLRLQRCGEALDIQFPNDNVKPGRTFVSVSCHSGKPWTIYVTATIDMIAEVAVAGKSLMPNQVLTKSDITFETRKLSRLRSGYFHSVDDILQMQVKRPVNPGQVITPVLLKQRFLVTRGQQVTLIAKVGAISVRMKGQALADATSNSRVRVKNHSSGRVIEGLVEGEGLVRIPM